MTAYSTADNDWQAGRNRLNHDWLKNKFTLSLEKAVKIAQERIEDDEFAERFINTSLPEFEREMQNVRDLIKSFESSMSPCVLLAREPLCRLKERYQVWLRQVVHVCWRSRINAAELIETAICRLNDAVEAWKILNQCIEGKCGKLEGHQLTCCRKELIALRDACHELGAALTRFPNRIRVT